MRCTFIKAWYNLKKKIKISQIYVYNAYYLRFFLLLYKCNKLTTLSMLHWRYPFALGLDVCKVYDAKAHPLYTHAIAN